MCVPGRGTGALTYSKLRVCAAQLGGSIFHESGSEFHKIVSRITELFSGNLCLHIAKTVLFGLEFNKRAKLYFFSLKTSRNRV